MIDLPPPLPTLQIELASTGISKGLAQTTAPQLVVRGGLEFGDFSIEASGKNIDSNEDEGVESQLSAGFATKVGGFDVAARAGLKSIHGVAAQVDRRALELRGEVGRKIGTVRANVSIIFSPDDTGTTRRATFVEGGLAWEPRKGTRLGARLGRRERVLAPDYTAYNVGITQDIVPQLALDLRLFDTNQSALGYAFQRRVVASLRAKF